MKTLREIDLAQLDRLNQKLIQTSDFRAIIEISAEIRELNITIKEAEQAERDHEEKLAIIAHETARENRLAVEAGNQQIDHLLGGLKGE